LQKDFLKSLTDEIQFIIPRGLTVLFFKSKVNWWFSILRTMCFFFCNFFPLFADQGCFY
jgi:hypothetical protein